MMLGRVGRRIWTPSNMSVALDIAHSKKIMKDPCYRGIKHECRSCEHM